MERRTKIWENVVLVKRGTDLARSVLILYLIFKEVLREKQNHIEHLLIERDLDRQDSENNAMMFQKTINQVCIVTRAFLTVN